MRCVRPDFTTSSNSAAFRSSDVASEPERGQEIVRELPERGQMHGRREDVVRRLAHVHVVVRMNTLAGDRRDDLVRVHVRARPRARLEDVDRELVVELAGGDAVAGGGDAVGEVVVEQPEVGVDTRSGRLDPSQPACDGDRDGLAGDGEVGDRLLGLGTPQGLLLGCLRHRGECSAGRSDSPDAAARADRRPGVLDARGRLPEHRVVRPAADDGVGRTAGCARRLARWADELGALGRTGGRGACVLRASRRRSPSRRLRSGRTSRRSWVRSPRPFRTDRGSWRPTSSSPRSSSRSWCRSTAA